jgi:hypothetical protein
VLLNVNNEYIYENSINDTSKLTKYPIILSGISAGNLTTCNSQSTFIIGGTTYTPTAIGFY